MRKFVCISTISIMWLLVLPLNCFASFDWSFGSMVGVKWVNVRWTQDKQNDSLIHVIQKWINWVLGMLAFISLCLVLYAWFLMLTSGWDSKKYDKWLSIIKYVAVWLAVIAVSRLIVSLIFYVINWAMADNGVTE